MQSEVEKLVRENEVLRRELEKMKDTIVELQTQNENQTWKNSCLVKDMGSISTHFDELKKNSRELEGFIPQYKMLNTKFPDVEAKQLIFKYEKLEDLCLELNKKIAELEASVHASDVGRHKAQTDFDSKVDALMLKDANREKQMKGYLERLKEKELEIKDAEEYKRNYMLLQKKIQKIFIDWNSQIKVDQSEVAQANLPTRCTRWINAPMMDRKLISKTQWSSWRSWRRRLRSLPRINSKTICARSSSRLTCFRGSKRRRAGRRVLTLSCHVGISRKT